MNNINSNNNPISAPLNDDSNDGISNSVGEPSPEEVSENIITSESDSLSGSVVNEPLQPLQLQFERHIAASFTEQELESDGFTNSDLSQLMHGVYNEVLDEYDGDWDSPEDAFTAILEIADRHEEIISNPAPLAVYDQVVELGTVVAFEFMAGRWVEVFDIDISPIFIP